ncbi:MAG: hypothetical protein ACRCX2_15215 [Paraclostridium sp.]
MKMLIKEFSEDLLMIEKNGLFMSFPKNKNSIIDLFCGKNEKFSAGLSNGEYRISSIKEDHFDATMYFSKSEFLELLNYFEN